MAQHAATGDAEIRLSCDCDCRRIELEVRDRGVGYATTGHDDPDRNARRPLRGMGLFQLQQTLLYRGGHLKVVSGPGEGTRVRLSVPDDAMENDPDIQDLSPPPVPPLAKRSAG